MWPAVCAGTSMTSKRRPSTSTTSPSAMAHARLRHALAAGAVHRTVEPRAQPVDTADVIGVVVGQ